MIAIVVVAVLLALFLAVVVRVVACREALDDALDDTHRLSSELGQARAELRQTRQEVTHLRRVAALVELELQREIEERREGQLVIFEVLEERGLQPPKRSAPSTEYIN
jgi:uncharacterized membrane-anchored protein YhcB (DUF1043 family)